MFESGLSCDNSIDILTDGARTVVDKMTGVLDQPSGSAVQGAKSHTTDCSSNPSAGGYVCLTAPNPDEMEEKESWCDRFRVALSFSFSLWQAYAPSGNYKKFKTQITGVLA